MAQNSLSNLGTLRSLFVRILPYRKSAVLIAAALVVEMLFYASIPMSFKLMIDRALLGHEPSVLTWILVGLGGGVIVSCAAGVGRDYVYAKVVNGVLGDLRRQLFTHLQRLPISFYRSDRTGETLACFSGNLTTIESALTAALAWVLLPAMEATLSLILLFFLEWRLALVALLVFPMTLIGPRFFAPRASQASYRRRELEAQALATVHENLGAQPVIKAFNLEQIACAAFESQNQQVQRSGVRVSFLSSMIERSAAIGILTLHVVILAGGGLLAQHEILSLGALAAFVTLYGTLSYSLSYVTQYFPSLVLAGGAMRQINELLQVEPHVEDCQGAVLLPRLDREVVFKDVSFGYAAGQVHIHNVSLDVRQGQSVALVGPSGCGKSTVINLLMRFYDPSKGAVVFDGRDLRTASQESLRRQIGLVLQESILFNTTVRENIRMGKRDASDAEIEEAARAAEMHDAICAMSQGYDTVVGERGSRLSGGQRQRLAIARAIVGKPPILILDEATASLDPGTEAAINATLAALARGHTVINVTHRLATVVNMDVIYVFDQGRLVERGRHGELLDRHGAYARLWQKQAGFAPAQDGLSSRLDASKLGELPILQFLSAELQQAAAQMFISEHHPAYRLVIQQGDEADRFYVVVRGKVEVLTRSPDGKDQRVRVLEDGDYFGEVGLLFKVPRSASVRTLVPTLFLILTRTQFFDLLDRVPDLKKKIVELGTERYRSMPEPLPAVFTRRLERAALGL